MNVADILKRATDLTDAAAQSETGLLEKSAALGTDSIRSPDLLYRKSAEFVADLIDPSRRLRRKLKRVLRPVLRRLPRRGRVPQTALRNAMQQMPLMRAERTYNTSHPEYDASLVRNFPGHIFNCDTPCANASFGAVLDQSEHHEGGG